MPSFRFQNFPRGSLLPWGLVFLLGLAGPLPGQSNSQELPNPPATHHHKASADSSSTPAAPSAPTAAALAQANANVARLTEANQDLLDLLKKQQAVLEDIQYDRRLQNRQISSLEERLEESLQENAELQAKIAKLEEQISLGPAPAETKTADNNAPNAAPASNSAPAATAPSPAPEATPPISYLPPAEDGSGPNTKWWHRLFTLSGTDGKSTDYFKVEGRQWRVVWHNQDRPGDAYANTSALFISAFPKDDTIPQPVCSKLGSGGDSTDLNGPGEFYLKIEASGGSWELAVEDMR